MKPYQKPHDEASTLLYKESEQIQIKKKRQTQDQGEIQEQNEKLSEIDEEFSFGNQVDPEKITNDLVQGFLQESKNIQFQFNLLQSSAYSDEAQESFPDCADMRIVEDYTLTEKLAYYQPVIKIQDKYDQMLRPLMFSSKYLKLPQLSIRLKSKKIFELNLYSQEFQWKFQYFPPLKKQLSEQKSRSYDINIFVAQLESHLKRDTFKMIVGFVYPEKPSQVDEMNDFANKLLIQNKIKKFTSKVGVKLIFLNYFQLASLTLFKNFCIPSNFYPVRTFRAEQYTQVIQSRLAFIMYVKDFERLRKCIDFKPISTTEIIIATEEHMNNFFKNEIPQKPEQKEQQQSEPEFEPVTDEEDQLNKNV